MESVERSLDLLRRIQVTENEGMQINGSKTNFVYK